MTAYFRADTSRYEKRMKHILLISLLPLFSGSVIAVLVLFLNLRVFLLSGFARYIAGAVAAAVFFSIPLCWLVIGKTRKTVNGNTRCTFFDIGESELVFSRYAGEYIRQGERVVLRRMDVIPLKSLDFIKINLKSGKLLLISNDNGIRSYTAPEERLNYRFANGKLDFDNWWFNDNCYKALDELFIPDIFGDAEKLGRSISEAKKRFEQKPEKKPYVHKELDFVKRKKAAEALKKLNLR